MAGVSTSGPVLRSRERSPKTCTDTRSRWSNTGGRYSGVRRSSVNQSDEVTQSDERAMMWARSLEGRHTAVNDEFRAQHESGFGRRQIEYPGGDLLRRAKPFYRDLALNPIFSLLNCFRRSVAQKR